jgi:hypothetical protein
MKYTQAALAAKAIKKELQTKYPNLLISVKSENYSMGDNVNVRLYVENIEDIVSIDSIQEITNKYEYGHFDGMIDYYENDNVRDDIPQTKYLFVNIDYSPKVIKHIIDRFNAYWDGQFVATMKENESYYFKDKKIGLYESENQDAPYWIRQFIQKNYQ